MFWLQISTCWIFAKTFLHIVFKTIHEKNYLLHNSDIKRFHQINVFIVIQDWNLSIYCNLVILQMYYNFTNIHSAFVIVVLVCFRWFCTIFPCLLWSIALMTLALNIMRRLSNQISGDNTYGSQFIRQNSMKKDLFRCIDISTESLFFVLLLRF